MEHVDGVDVLGYAPQRGVRDRRGVPEPLDGPRLDPQPPCHEAAAPQPRAVLGATAASWTPRRRLSGPWRATATDDGSTEPTENRERASIFCQRTKRVFTPSLVLTPSIIHSNYSEEKRVGHHIFGGFILIRERNAIISWLRKMLRTFSECTK